MRKTAQAGSVAIVGGGPAGALLAARLAAAGRPVVVIEERPGWEKPCGGGLTDKALQRYSFLADPTASNRVDECELRSPAGRRLRLALDRPVAIFARQDLNGLLLERARAAGAEVVADRVVACAATARGPDQGWLLSLRGGETLQAAAVFNCAGARNPLPALPSPLGVGDWMATAGYYVAADGLPWPAARMIIQFLPGLEGYIWSFPRSGHASIGICGRLGEATTAGLRRRLEAWLDAERVAWRGRGRFYAHLLPAPSALALENARLAGIQPAPWALAGDAAGLVDPITGEGLYYALRSAELLAEAVLSDEHTDAEPAMIRYASALRTELLPELIAAARIAPRFYAGRFAGEAVLERMAQFGRRSAIFRRVLCDLFSGAQGYRGLRRRLYRNLAPSLWQIATARGAWE